MTAYTIGIDTGGTYTDAALMDPAARRLVAKAKALTTKGDLSVGVNEALAGILSGSNGGPAIPGSDIGMVALSTTLATNAIVEGHGAPVGVVLAGFGARMVEKAGISEAVPDARLISLAGGHDHAGTEREDLDLEALDAFLDETAETVEAYAVAAHYSVRNPAHEHRMRDLIRDRTGKPVTISSELAEALDAPRRALTAALNARIISRIVALIDAVRRGMAGHGIEAPLMIVKGDGTLAASDHVAERPIETTLSGPAASVIGAKFLSGLSDFVIADIGGTTTDVATLKGGWPRLNREGSVVGGWRTMVRAVDMRTLGLGGDSEVAMDGPGDVYLKPNRVAPVSMIASVWPDIIPRMQAMLADPQGTRYGGRFALRPLGTGSAAAPADLSKEDKAFLDVVPDRPVPLHEILNGLADQRALARLSGRGLVQVAAFTPSDAAHILDMQNQWSRPAAVLASLLLKRSRRMIREDEGDAEARAFAAETVDALVKASGRILVETLSGETFGSDDPVLRTVLSGGTRLNDLDVVFRPSIPIVGVGGPAPVFYPEIGRRLNTDIVLPEAADVANAVGAAVALVKVQAVVEITTNGRGGFRIHHDGDPLRATSPGDALEQARSLAHQTARHRAEALGGAPDRIDVHVERIDIPDSPGDTGLIAATIIAECWGRPSTEA